MLAFQFRCGVVNKGVNALDFLLRARPSAAYRTITKIKQQLARFCKMSE